MYVITKSDFIDSEKVNVLCNPLTNEPYKFDDLYDAQLFAEQHGFSDAEIIDITLDVL